LGAEGAGGVGGAKQAFPERQAGVAGAAGAAAAAGAAGFAVAAGVAGGRLAQVPGGENQKSRAAAAMRADAPRTAMVVFFIALVPAIADI